jgi:hypothetical protein
MAYLNGCWFVAGSSGTADFSDGAGLTGYRNLADAGAANSATYSYRAKHPTDDSIWEIGQGAYSSGGGTLGRTVIASSTGSKVAFAVAPIVSLEPIKEDLDLLAPKASPTFTGTVSGITKAMVGLSAVTNDAQLKAASNLSDVADAATAFGNIKQGASASATGVVEKATDAEVRSSASDKYLSADLIESASAAVALTAGSSIAVDWDAGINFTLTTNQNCTLSNPSNGQPGTWRTILVTNGASHTMGYGNQFVFPGGSAPVIAVSSGLTRLSIYCRTASIFEVYAPGIGLA